ncbi:helix-turn-helix domain-containing protein [Lentzea waywayandensis]|uniref:helix-turn-helix domain-containing protein n=1 Tax=Lentzea waywayandensis TaxID=84724 RepID=UPI000A753B13|nr:helix-turn-helix domain-containing protein [Lentzea waywayandensis]
MLSLEEDVEAQALRAQGWSVSAIARHLGRDRKTIRRYLSGQVMPGSKKVLGGRSVRAVHRVLPGQAGRRPALVGVNAARRDRRTRLPGRLLDIHPCFAPSPAAPALRAVSCDEWP